MRTHVRPAGPSVGAATGEIERAARELVWSSVELGVDPDLNP